MRRIASLFLFVAAFATPFAASAEVKSVRMHIAGYLCGN
jgi:hypothetical protein